MTRVLVVVRWLTALCFALGLAMTLALTAFSLKNHQSWHGTAFWAAIYLGFLLNESRRLKNG